MTGKPTSLSRSLRQSSCHKLASSASSYAFCLLPSARHQQKAVSQTDKVTTPPDMVAPAEWHACIQESRTSSSAGLSKLSTIKPTATPRARDHSVMLSAAPAAAASAAPSNSASRVTCFASAAQSPRSPCRIGSVSSSLSDCLLSNY
ncbi:hypothetical protein CTA1_6884 [Colletotrichum tanaceti]|uniref:Uncharacterized protein n=1 Tax=Colletotrichum tanaceti TaxID=1306861 RepID=A0A4U6XM93_9PEZI|nr:hypothetical protein CTA1_6884 [Colletotrichum tanaceti]